MANWKANNSTAITVGVVCFGIMAGFLFIVVGTEALQSELYLTTIFLALSFLVPSLLTHLGILALNGSAGAFRFAIAFSIAWVIADAVSTLERKYPDKVAFLVGLAPIFVFWSSIWVKKGFAQDSGSDYGSQAAGSKSTLSIPERSKRRTALEDLIELIYGTPPPPKTAVLSEAIKIASNELLLNQVSGDEVAAMAIELFETPMPYSTHELAYATALNFFKQPERKASLMEAQLVARANMLGLLDEKKLNVNFAKVIEDTLYKLYKPT